MARTAKEKKATGKKRGRPPKARANALDALAAANAVDDYDLGFDTTPPASTPAAAGASSSGFNDYDENMHGGTPHARKAPPPNYRAGITHAPAREAPRRNNPPEHSRFKPGQSGNPLGGKLHDPALKAVKNLTKKELAEIGNLVVKGDVAMLRELAEDEGETVLKRMVASVCFRVIDFGDMGALDTLLNRLVGKVKDEVKHEGDVARVIVTLPSNGREAKV